MDPRLGEYRDLVEDRSGRYVLVASTGVLPCDPVSCLVYDCQTETALIVEDDDVFVMLNEALIARGAPVLAKFPGTTQ
jgi:hypothetical protein